jgi:hypothetical protein
LVNVSHYISQLSKGTIVSLTLDVGSFKYPIKTIDGNPYSVSKANIAGKGKLKIQMCLPHFAYSMCGWIERVSREVLGSMWKRRYFVLCDRKLTYFDKIDEMQTVKKSADCKTVVSITSSSFKGDACFCIQFGTEASNKIASTDNRWTIRFVPEDSPQRVAMWMRKISRSCELIKADVDKNVFLTPRAMEGALESQRRSEQTSVSGPRRRSIFFN